MAAATAAAPAALAAAAAAPAATVAAADDDAALRVGTLVPWERRHVRLRPCCRERWPGLAASLPFGLCASTRALNRTALAAEAAVPTPAERLQRRGRGEFPTRRDFALAKGRVGTLLALPLLPPAPQACHCRRHTNHGKQHYPHGAITAGRGVSATRALAVVGAILRSALRQRVPALVHRRAATPASVCCACRAIGRSGSGGGAAATTTAVATGSGATAGKGARVGFAVEEEEEEHVLGADLECMQHRIQRRTVVSGGAVRRRRRPRTGDGRR